MIKALLPIIALLLGGSVGAEETIVDKYYAWEYACTLQQEHRCVGIKPPRIMMSNMGTAAHGMFRGGKVIYINSSTREPGTELYRATLVHEMTHYLDFKRGSLYFGPLNATSVCRSEERAFTVMDAYLDMVGKSAFKRGPGWWTSYWHCEPQYNPNWEVWEWLFRGSVNKRQQGH